MAQSHAKSTAENKEAGIKGHLLVLALICIALVAILIAWPGNSALRPYYLPIAAIILCLVMHFWIMKEHNKGRHGL